MKRLLLLFIAFSHLAVLHSQERPIINIPDLPGYQTLVCDFHLHTVFSDGKVWPTVRVDEALREGLDAIAITDHLEYLPHKTDIRTDYNRSWQIASAYADGKGVIVIPGTEITKGMPPGHFNAIFIKDATPFLNQDYKVAIETAAGQGAFITWNHPGWKAQQPDTMKWWDEHTWIYEQGWLHGIEVVNDGEFYPEAVDWAKEKGLTMLGTSDAHGPFLHRDFDAGNHRPLTLVFATEKSAGGIREALFNGRTAAYNNNQVIGKPAVLNALFLESVHLEKSETGKHAYTLVNTTALPFQITLVNKVYDETLRKILLNPGVSFTFELSAQNALEEIDIRVRNFITGADETLVVKLSSLHTEG
ncbi:MAG: PHP domain-containing protein [Bacteroidales bacterium]|nr:PHP domain-containing protein [Bacteroidales bacterium]MDT8430318.1 PHP domain-containing protein [Bacteroidales bacterium]